MAKFKVSFELQSLKVNIEGEREDIPVIMGNLGQQIAGVLQPTANIIDGDAPAKAVQNLAESVNSQIEPKARARRRPSRGAPATASPDDAGVLNWKHDPQKWGTPQQDWSTLQKCLWTLYVIQNELSQSEVAGPTLARTFNQHFKQAGKIHPPNVTRDLGKAKTGKDALVGENTTVSPSTWFLTDSGNQKAQELVSVSLGDATNSIFTRQKD
jgi:hypothetical protein